MTFTAPGQMDGSNSSHRSKNSNNISNNSGCKDLGLRPFRVSKEEIKAFSPPPMIGKNNSDESEDYDSVQEMIKRNYKNAGSRLQSPNSYSNTNKGQNNYMNYNPIEQIPPSAGYKDQSSYSNSKNNGSGKKGVLKNPEQETKPNFTKLGTTFERPKPKFSIVGPNNRRNTNQLDGNYTQMVVNNITTIPARPNLGGNIRQGAISPTCGMNITRALSPGLGSEIDEQEEFNQDGQTRRL